MRIEKNNLAESPVAWASRACFFRPKNTARTPRPLNPRHAFRYPSLLILIVAMLFFAAPSPLEITAVSAATIEENLTPATELAVMKGLGYLSQQQQADGSFTGFDEPGPRVAPAAQVLLAFLSTGQTPAVGRHALATRNAVDFIVRQLPDDGDFGRADGSGIFGQAIITIALAEIHGLDTDAARRSLIQDALKKSLAVIISTQDSRNDARAGGWREGGNGEGELEATLWMVLALRALKDADFDVPKEAMQRAVSFVRACAKRNAAAFSNRDGGPTPLTNAAGIAVLLLAGIDGKDNLKEPHKFLVEHRPNEEATDFFTTLYVSSLAAMQEGEPKWTPVWKPIRDILLGKQTAEGSWFPPRPPSVGLGTVAATSTAVMTLAMPYRLLPLYGR